MLIRPAGSINSYEGFRGEEVQKPPARVSLGGEVPSKKKPPLPSIKVNLFLQTYPAVPVPVPYLHPAGGMAYSCRTSTPPRHAAARLANALALLRVGTQLCSSTRPNHAKPDTSCTLHRTKLLPIHPLPSTKSDSSQHTLISNSQGPCESTSLRIVSPLSLRRLASIPLSTSRVFLRCELRMPSPRLCER